MTGSSIISQENAMSQRMSGGGATCANLGCLSTTDGRVLHDTAETAHAEDADGGGRSIADAAVVGEFSAADDEDIACSCGSLFHSSAAGFTGSACWACCGCCSYPARSKSHATLKPTSPLFASSASSAIALLKPMASSLLLPPRKLMFERLSVPGHSPMYQRNLSEPHIWQAWHVLHFLRASASACHGSPSACVLQTLLICYWTSVL
jgi:hypothetical protein